MLNKFTHQYPVSKTLRFELKPVGETAEYIEDFKSQYLKDIVAQDEQRAEDYKIIKEIIDDYHRNYIEEKLTNPCDLDTGELYITEEDFETAFSYFENFRINPKDNIAKKSWIDTQASLRKKLVKSFKGNGRLFSKELIKEDLEDWLKGKGEWDEQKDVVENFKNFTTYFTGFHENRKNMYSADDKSTAISFRLMNDNLPRFFVNCIQFHKMMQNYPEIDLSIEIEVLNKLGVQNLEDVFQPSFYTKFFTQSGIELFNELLGGRTEEGGRKVQGINEKINLFRQKQSIKAKTLPNLSILYKQILSDVESHSFIPEQFENDKDLLISLKALLDDIEDKNGSLALLESAVDKLHECDVDKTYTKGGLNITEISQKMFGNYTLLKNAIYYHVSQNIHPAPKSGKVSESLEQKRRNYINNQDAFSLGELENILLAYMESLDEDHSDKSLISEAFKEDHPIQQFYLAEIENAKNDEDNPFNSAIKNVLPLLEMEELNKGEKGSEQKQKIQKLLDSFLAIAHAVKPLHLVKGRKPLNIPDVDLGFYSDFSEAFEYYEKIVVGMYNKTRNHLTKQSFSKDKIKINFENPTLLDGWDANKEKDNSGLLFEKNGNYYLGIMHPKHRNIFDYNKGINDLENPKRIQAKDELFNKIVDGSHNHYNKIVYKLLPGANKMLPKVFFSKSRIDYFAPSNKVLQIRNTASHSKNGKPQKGFQKADFNLEDCHTIIDFFKTSIEKHPEWKEFKFVFSPTLDYKDLSDFYMEVSHQGYKMDFHPIKDSYINQCLEEGKLFLFQIYNKDFSPYSNGAPNLHTLYWKSLFDPENLKDVVIKLNGEAEIFYRKHSIKREDRTIHLANKALKNKNENNPKSESVFEFDLIKDRRYTVDKFQFHVPITLNFKSKGVYRFNDQINLKLKKSSDTHVIGIDRGERHLLYYTVISSKGEIVEQGSFNTIKTDLDYEVDYREKLDKKEKERDEARKSWTTVENIKELKAGYLSHVIHQLALLIRKYNAIVCLEDLNFGFKRGRFKVEKQVYQKFEKALIDKLNYLVFKDAKYRETGHCLNAYQLTAPFESFRKLGKQTGILYYVQAAYTSKIDPATGFMNFLYTRYESLAKSKTFFETMGSIRFNREKSYFEFSFDYSKMTPQRELMGYKAKWTLCTHGELRYKNIRNSQGHWESVPVNVTQELKALFDDYNIDYPNGKDLRMPIVLVKETKFYKKLYKLLSVTVSLRQSKTGTDEDFILSPVADANGNFFDSRNATDSLPKDADANGAYHIALKGLWNIQKIKEWDGEGKLNLVMKNVDWFSFAYRKPFKK